MIYNKLVRDGYRTLLAGKNVKFRVADDAEYREKLREKIVEEAYELRESGSKEELADLLEAVEHYMQAEGWGIAEIEEIKRLKAEEKGRFDGRLILIEADER